MTTTSVKPLNAAQKAAMAVYGDGDFAYIAEMSPEEAKAEINGLGDNLAKFIFLELSEDEGCDSVEEALNRMANAASDVQTVIAAIESVG